LSEREIDTPPFYTFIGLLPWDDEGRVTVSCPNEPRCNETTQDMSEESFFGFSELSESGIDITPFYTFTSLLPWDDDEDRVTVSCPKKPRCNETTQDMSEEALFGFSELSDGEVEPTPFGTFIA